MNLKVVIFTALVIGMPISGVSAGALINDEQLEALAIAFLVLCIVILIIALIVPLWLLHRKKSGQSVRSGSKYNLSKRETRLSSQANSNDSNVGVYGYYTAPQPTGSIYLPLDKRNGEDNGYAHLSGSTRTKEDNKEEEQHTYETLTSNNTFKGEKNAYDNPGAVLNDDKKGSDSDSSDHDYEMADANIRGNGHGPSYENPVEIKDRDETAF